MQKVKADKEQQNLKRKESINSLEVIDVSGSKTSLALSTNANNVTMDTGYNVQEYADARMKESARTFTSDGSPIEVNNGSDKSKILFAELTGKSAVFKRLLDSQDEWIEIPSDEIRDTTTYEYKLDSCQAIISNSSAKYPFRWLENIIELPTSDDKLILNEDGSATWIQASEYNEDGTEVVKLATPITRHIPKSECPVIPVN